MFGKSFYFFRQVTSSHSLFLCKWILVELSDILGFKITVVCDVKWTVNCLHLLSWGSRFNKISVVCFPVFISSHYIITFSLTFPFFPFPLPLSSCSSFTFTHIYALALHTSIHFTHMYNPFHCKNNFPNCLNNFKTSYISTTYFLFPIIYPQHPMATTPSRPANEV